MFKNTITTVAILSSALLTAGCRTEDAHGFLAGKFVDEEPMLASVVIPPAERGEYPMYFALHQGDRTCLLTGTNFEENFLFFSRCEGVSGTGRISCNDGRALNLQWTLTSCLGGYGRSIESEGPSFFFGFESNEEKALDQLKKAEQEN